MLQCPDLSEFSEEERMQLMTVMKKAQVYFVVICSSFFSFFLFDSGYSSPGSSS